MHRVHFSSSIMGLKPPLQEPVLYARLVAGSGTSLAYKTGSWRGGFKPVIDDEKCTRCMKCWLFCPDMAVLVSKGEDKLQLEINYDYCKGCGICEVECPVDAIEMARE